LEGLQSRNGPPQILGIDAAVDPKNVGLATAVQNNAGRWQVQAVASGAPAQDLAEQAAGLLEPGRPCLLAVDAPLGWPSPLSAALAKHRAGEPIPASSNELFIRETDRFVRERTGLKPLDIGADRIARTARAALALIDGIRRRTGQDLPLLLCLKAAHTGGLLETYPAATLRQSGLPAKGYKKPEARPTRQTILEGLAERLELGEHTTTCLDSDHCLDAVLCVLTAIEYLAGHCPPPQDQALAQTEGWIWFPEKGE